MKEICPQDECTGCGICAGVCPKNCISIIGDEFGYIHPLIDHTSCIDCGLCVKTCPNNNIIRFTSPLKAYAAWSINNTDRDSSTSGGVASVLSHHVVSENGIVYGAVGYGCGRVEHQSASSQDDIGKFKKSKYLQSYISRDIYRSIRQHLKDCKTVLFIGTPCQTAAVKAMSGDVDNLICVDIICHGVPSWQIFQDHITMVLDKNAQNVSSFTTRDNEGYFLTLYDGDKILYRKPFPKDQYLNGFQYGLFFRPSCYQCHYAQPNRQSDITIGDFWGLTATTYPHKKVSVILINTRKGAEMLNKVKAKLFLDERPVEEAIKGNSQLNQPSVKHEYYNLFRKLYLSHNYETAINRSLQKFYVKNAIYNVCMKVPKLKRLYLTIKR